MFYPKDFSSPAIDTKPESDRQWAYLDEVQNVTTGKIHSYTVAVKKLVAHKDQHGSIHIFDAYCPHQGTHLGCGSQMCNNRLRCPFHGLYFDTGGRSTGPNPFNETTFIDNLKLTPIEQRINSGKI